MEKPRTHPLLLFYAFFYIRPFNQWAWISLSDSSLFFNLHHHGILAVAPTALRRGGHCGHSLPPLFLRLRGLSLCLRLGLLQRRAHPRETRGLRRRTYLRHHSPIHPQHAHLWDRRGNRRGHMVGEEYEERIYHQ